VELDPVNLNRGGWLVWGTMLLLAWALPGQVWRPASIPEFPVRAIFLFAALVAGLILAAPFLVAIGGRRLARSRLLSALEAPPAVLWGILVLAGWPAALGPPGIFAWILAFLAFALPTEIRWLAQALPPEQPFPAAWGKKALLRSRNGALRTFVPNWIAARLPVWIMATLVIERVMGFQGLGSDWVARVAARDRIGVALWVAALAGLWTLSHPFENPDP
jgi:hypothetical protein